MSDRSLDLAFIPMLIYLQYKSTGKGNFYKVEFTILTAEEFGEKVAGCSKNELLAEDITGPPKRGGENLSLSLACF